MSRGDWPWDSHLHWPVAGLIPTPPLCSFCAWSPWSQVHCARFSPGCASDTWGLWHRHHLCRAPSAPKAAWGLSRNLPLAGTPRPILGPLWLVPGHQESQHCRGCTPHLRGGPHPCSSCRASRSRAPPSQAAVLLWTLRRDRIKPPLPYSGLACELCAGGVKAR